MKRFSRSSTKDEPLLAPPIRSIGGSGPPSPALLTKRSPRSSPSFPSGPLPSASPSSSYPFPHTPPPPPASAFRSIERPLHHSTLASLSVLLAALDRLRETTTARAKAEKEVGKAVRELSKGFGEKLAGEGGQSEVIVQALAAASMMGETIAEVDAKYAKGLEKDYEALNSTVEKYFKKTAVRFCFPSSCVLPFSPTAIVDRRKRRLTTKHSQSSTRKLLKRPRRTNLPPVPPPTLATPMPLSAVLHHSTPPTCRCSRPCQRKCSRRKLRTPTQLRSSGKLSVEKLRRHLREWPGRSGGTALRRRGRAARRSGGC